MMLKGNSLEETEEEMDGKKTRVALHNTGESYDDAPDGDDGAHVEGGSTEHVQKHVAGHFSEG